MCVEIKTSETSHDTYLNYGMYTESRQTHKIWAKNCYFVSKYKRLIASILNHNHDSIINFVSLILNSIFTTIYTIFIRLIHFILPLSGFSSWRRALVVKLFRSIPKNNMRASLSTLINHVQPHKSTFPWLQDMTREHLGSWKCASLNLIGSANLK